MYYRIELAQILEMSDPIASMAAYKKAMEILDEQVVFTVMRSKIPFKNELYF